MISMSCLRLSLYRVPRLCETASYNSSEEGEEGKRGEVKVQRDRKKREREIVKKTPRDGCREKPQSGSCDSGIARLRGKCSGLALQRAV